jgi:hypothetical protein
VRPLSLSKGEIVIGVGPCVAQHQPVTGVDLTVRRAINSLDRLLTRLTVAAVGIVHQLRARCVFCVDTDRPAALGGVKELGRNAVGISDFRRRPVRLVGLAGDHARNAF